MYSEIEAYVGHPAARVIPPGYTAEAKTPEEMEALEAFEMPVGAFLPSPPPHSRYYAVTLDACCEEDSREPGVSTARIGRAIRYLRPVSLREMAATAEERLGALAAQNGQEAKRKIRDIESEKEHSVEVNTQAHAMAVRVAHGSIAANTADYARAVSTGQGGIAASTGNHSLASVVQDCAAAVCGGWGSTALTQYSKSVAVALASESLAMCSNEFVPLAFKGDEPLDPGRAGQSAAVSVGGNSATVAIGRRSVAVVLGQASLAECDGNGAVALAMEEDSAAAVDGETIRADVYYRLEGGRLVECPEGKEVRQCAE